MTVKDARSEFARLMALARQRSLTDGERRTLQRASQVMRYAKRTTAARNPRSYEAIPSLKDWNMFAGGTGAAPGKHSYSIQVGSAKWSIDPISNQWRRHLGYRLSVWGLPPHYSHKDLGMFRSPQAAVTKAREVNRHWTPTTNKVTRKEAAQTHRTLKRRVGGKEARAIYRTAKARGYIPPKKNPGGLVRMGKLVELRYYRDHGRKPGYYKHPFTTRPTLYFDPRTNSIIAKGGK